MYTFLPNHVYSLQVLPLLIHVPGNQDHAFFSHTYGRAPLLLLTMLNREQGGEIARQFPGLVNQPLLDRNVCRVSIAQRQLLFG